MSKNEYGEYNYQFNWVDVDGVVIVFDNVWALNKKDAIKKAKKREIKSGWSLYSEVANQYLSVPREIKGGGKCFYNKGKYVEVSSMKRIKD